jgi:hypothetical protein
MSVAGTYDCVVKTPMGDQKAAFTVTPSDDGTSFSGGLSSDMMGSMDIESGSIDGSTLSWQMKMTVPMPMDLDCQATIDGDQLTGSVNAGAFGSMALTGQRSG